MKTSEPSKAPSRRELKSKEFQGASLQEAERIARESIPGEVLGIEVVRDVQILSTTAQGSTEQEVRDAAVKRLPAEALNPESPKIVQEPQSGTSEISEWDEREARKVWRKKAPRGAEIVDIRCTAPPKNGVLGMGKKPGTWTIKWSAPYFAEVTYTMPAVVRAQFLE